MQLADIFVANYPAVLYNSLIINDSLKINGVTLMILSGGGERESTMSEICYRLSKILIIASASHLHDGCFSRIDKSGYCYSTCV